MNSKHEHSLTNEKVGFVLFMLFEYMKQNKYGKKLNYLLLLSANLEGNVVTKIEISTALSSYACVPARVLLNRVTE